MRAIASVYCTLSARIETAGDRVLPLFARFAFAATLLVYYWSSAMTKLGEGPLGLLRPSDGAYYQILPKKFEAAGYDSTALSMFDWLVVVTGTAAELILPALIVIGLLSRLAALGMIGFVVLQSLTDIFGHGLTDLQTVGRWFDNLPDGVLLDQRLFWVFLLSVIVVRGAGALSVDAFLLRRMQPALA